MTVQDVARYLVARGERELAPLVREYVRPAPPTAELVGIFGLGALVGIGVGLLLAPKPGRELRTELAHRIGEFREGYAHGDDGDVRPS